MRVHHSGITHPVNIHLNMPEKVRIKEDLQKIWNRHVIFVDDTDTEVIEKLMAALKEQHDYFRV